MTPRWGHPRPSLWQLLKILFDWNEQSWHQGSPVNVRLLTEYLSRGVNSMVLGPKEKPLG